MFFSYNWHQALVLCGQFCDTSVYEFLNQSMSVMLPSLRDYILQTVTSRSRSRIDTVRQTSHELLSPREKGSCDYRVLV